MTWETAMAKAIERSAIQRRRFRVFGWRGFLGWNYAAMPVDEYAMMTADLP